MHVAPYVRRQEFDGRLRSLARSLGVRWFPGKWGSLFICGARNTGLIYSFGVSTDGELAHEIGHTLIASPDRRNLLGYGLGINRPHWSLDYDHFAGYADAPVLVDDPATEEEEASLCGLLLLEYLGIPFLADAREQGWLWRGTLEEWRAELLGQNAGIVSSLKKKQVLPRQIARRYRWLTPVQSG